MGLFDLEIIDEHNNFFAISFINVLNAIAGGECMNVYELTNRIEEVSGDNERYFSEKFEDIKRERYILFDEDYNKKLKSRIDSPISIPISATEKIYMKAVLNTDYAKLFMNNNDIERLLDELKVVPLISFDEIFVSTPKKNGNGADMQTDKLKLLLDAISSKSEIVYSNTARNGDKYLNRKGFPVRIEYSVIMDVFYLSLWSTAENRPVKINISTMFDIAFTGNIWKGKKTPSEMLESKRIKAPIDIVFFADDNRRTFERAIIRLSSYEIVSAVDGSSLSVSYYEYDEDELLRDIITLGPYCKVVSPPEITDKIKERLCAFC